MSFVCSVSYYTVRVYWCEVARSHVYRLVLTVARVSSTRSRHISCGAARLLLPARVTSHSGRCAPACRVHAQEEDRGWWWVSFEYSARYSRSVARRCTDAAKDALALESWVGFRHCHVSCARGVCLLPSALGRHPAPFVGQALLLAGGVHRR